MSASGELIGCFGLTDTVDVLSVENAGVVYFEAPVGETIVLSGGGARFA